jgi:hypothetical protein
MSKLSLARWAENSYPNLSLGVSTPDVISTLFEINISGPPIGAPSTIIFNIPLTSVANNITFQVSGTLVNANEGNAEVLLKLSIDGDFSTVPVTAFGGSNTSFSGIFNLSVTPGAHTIELTAGSSSSGISLGVAQGLVTLITQ